MRRSLLLLAVLLPGCMASRRVQVERVIDGETLLMAGGERVRLIGVDAPELNSNLPEMKSYAEKAKALTEKLVLNKRVRLRFDQQRKDRFGHSLAYVYADGISVNEKLLHEGLARVVRRIKFQEKKNYIALEKRAERAGRGIWQLKFARAEKQSEGDLVYLTLLGKKYHRAVCRYLKKTKIPTRLSEARIDYEPCSVCKPPQ